MSPTDVTRSPSAEHALRANNFDLIRLLAALQVALAHSFAWVGVPIPGLLLITIHCFPGVSVFFVISGFLVTRSYLDGDRGLLSYFGRRALRVYPALWLQYVLVIILLWVTGGFVLDTLADSRFWSWMVRAAFIGSNFWAGALTNYSPFVWTGLYQWYPADVLWTIPVELGFYLLVPLVFAKWIVRRRLVIPVVAAAFAGSVVAAFIAGPLLRDHGNLNSTGMIHSSPLPYFWLFLAGAVATFYWDKAKWLFDGTALWWLAAYSALSAAKWLAVGSVDLTYRIPDAFTVPRGLLMAGVVISFAHSWVWISKWLRGVDLSYGLYLFHLPLPFGLHYAGIGGSYWYVALSLVVAFGLAAFSWFVVEKPALGLKNLIRPARPLGRPA